jgi:lipoic acid synthetase
MDALIQLNPAAPRLPEWLRKPRTHFDAVHHLKSELRRLNLHTVCESARCPNMHECFHRGTATFMILGNLCTRGCGFCSVPKSRHPGALDPDEPENVARMAASMRLRHVVITSVNRDDLPDGGSGHFAAVVRKVRAVLSGDARIEVLTPDFQGDLVALARVLDAEPHIFNHNMETVSRLYLRVRPQADYRQSLDVLKFAKRYRPAALVKSGAMLGLGETPDEVHQLMRDLRAADVDIVTLGQYLQPTRRNLPVAEFVSPVKFDACREFGLSLGFKMVFSGPLVRSSYMADAVADQA